MTLFRNNLQSGKIVQLIDIFFQERILSACVHKVTLKTEFIIASRESNVIHLAECIASPSM